jgi:hypothetical protein
MKKNEIAVGKVYAVKISGRLAPVMLTSVSQYGGWYSLNLRSKRDVRIHTAAKLRFELTKTPTGNWMKTRL